MHEIAQNDSAYYLLNIHGVHSYYGSTVAIGCFILLFSLWMSTINARVTAEGPVSDVSLTIVSAELLEYLYHNEASLPLITPVSIKSVSYSTATIPCHYCIFLSLC